MRLILDWPDDVNRRTTLIFVLVAAGLAVFLVMVYGGQPLYTDVYYHLNVANRLIDGHGMTETYLWNYTNAPAPMSGAWAVPSHAYWMPLTSLMAAAGMAFTGAHGSYAAAQLPFVLAVWGIGLIGFAAGARLGRTSLLAWVAGLLTLLSPFYARVWGAIDSTTPFALAGSACVLILGGLLAVKRAPRAMWLWWAAAGALAALAHLARPDGVILLGVGGLTALISARRARRWGGLWVLLPLVIGYLACMTPWFMRNLQESGTILPAGGLQGVFFTEYDDLFAWPPVTGPGQFLDKLGWNGVVSTRLAALFGQGDGLISGNFGTFLAVEGMIFLAPLMIFGLVNRWRDPFLWPFMLAALFIHLVMTVVFPFAGYRGGLLHSAGALVPFWAALGAVGLSDVIRWIAKRRRTWHYERALPVFAGGLVALALLMLFALGARGITGPSAAELALYSELDARLPPGARVFSADPPALYYYTGRGGAVLPNSPQDTLAELAERYDIRFALIAKDGLPSQLADIWAAPAPFLEPVPSDLTEGRLYAILAQPAGS